MVDRLKDKVALITGGAGGMGTTIGKLYVDEGAIVVLADIKESKPEKELVSKSNRISFQKLDVTDESQWEKLISETIDEFDHLDILINTAGISAQTLPIQKISLKDWQKVLNINLTGQFLGIKHAFETMKKRGGSIVNICSIGGGRVALPGPISPYEASKGGVRVLSRGAAIEVATRKYNIRVNSIYPGIIKHLCLLRT